MEEQGKFINMPGRSGLHVLEIHCLVDQWINLKARLPGHVGVHLSQVSADTEQLMDINQPDHSLLMPRLHIDALTQQFVQEILHLLFWSLLYLFTG